MQRLLQLPHADGDRAEISAVGLPIASHLPSGGREPLQIRVLNRHTAVNQSLNISNDRRKILPYREIGQCSQRLKRRFLYDDQRLFAFSLQPMRDH